MARILLVTALVLSFVFSGCDLLNGGGGGTGGGSGGGGGAMFTFKKGFTFLRKDDRNIYIADESDYDDNRAKLTNVGGISSPSFSKDGATIVAVQKVGQDTQLVSVPTAGGTLRVVLASDTLKKNFKQPVFSPDGMTIAFSYDESVSASIGLVNTDGSNFRKLIGGGSLGYSLPTFSPDGKTVYAAAGSSGSIRQIEAINMTTVTPSSAVSDLGVEVTNIENRLAVSPDGKKIVFDGKVSSGVTRIFVTDLTSKMTTKLNEYMGENGVNDTAPTWLDADTVAFSSDSGGNDQVYKIAVSGTGTRMLILSAAIEPFFGAATP